MAAPYCPVNPASAMAVLYSIWRAMGARTSSKSASSAKAIMSLTVRLLRLSGGWAASSEKGLFRPPVCGTMTLLTFLMILPLTVSSMRSGSVPSVWRASAPA